MIFIVGMHRSGTSALTRVLSLCGAALPGALMAPNSGNPTGYWEPADAMELNDRFLHARSSSWSDPGLTFRNAPRDHAGFARYVALIRHFLALIDEFLTHGVDPGGPVVIKEPRITALLPYWLTAAAEAGFSTKVIHIFRNPADVASSLAARDGMAFDRACALWQKYNLLGEHDARAIPRAFVAYEALIDDWERTIERCAAETGVDLRVRPMTRAAVETFLSPKLQHHRSGTIERNSLAPVQRKAVRRAYDMLQRAADGALDTATFDSLLLEYSARWAGGTDLHERDVRLNPTATPISA
ncbi:MAG: sulfotransferase [Candidatus Eremiobacteraeota bacterium]|nr:sulfotransferase [Candidatus Eremiobacteraeota bacterium]